MLSWVMINGAISSEVEPASSSSSPSLSSGISRATWSGYGQGRIKNQPSAMGVGVPSARVSKKPEVFPGKNVRAIVEKRKADSPNPEMTIPVIVDLYI